MLKLPWLNNISDVLKGDNKYRQMALAQEIGFKMPKTIVSNNKKDLLNFAKLHEDIILKLAHQDAFKKNNKVYGFYTYRLKTDDVFAFKDNKENPIILQEYIDKKYEVRYTIVGNEHFACKIDSQKSQIANEDWRRYDLAKTPHSIINPPLHIKSKVKKMMKNLNIEFGALDFIINLKNEWIFLEINCSGQWLWIEDLSGLDISGAIARWCNNAKH
ncbi:hypothetical protein [Campylobacter upsaliensis]|uniref:hypothetical protein n=1 Tax=Campylobacter upsaliensis TaxID=28080 RepID=UPI0022EAA458|nr:hypothetical protein [Campylobacter upsaliensis]